MTVEPGPGDRLPPVIRQPVVRQPVVRQPVSGTVVGQPAFRQEVRVAVRYERGLVVKAIAVLAVLAVILVLRTLYFS